MLTYEKIKKLCKRKGVTVTGLESELGFAKGSLCKVNTNKPSMEKVQKLANYFSLSTSELLEENDAVTLTLRDERDIAKRLESALSDLEDQQEALMFSGEPLDDETRELLKASLENSLRIAKINAKQKYTPKKYRKDTE